MSAAADALKTFGPKATPDSCATVEKADTPSDCEPDR